MFKFRLADLWRHPSSKPDTARAEQARTPPIYSANAAVQKRSSTDSDIILVERDKELDELKQFWRDAVAGHGRVVLLAGEAGHGKTTLSEALIALLANDPTPPKVARAASAAQSGRDEQFWPFTDALSQLVAGPASATKITGEVFDAFLEFAPSWAAVIPVAGPVVGASLKTAQVVRNRTKLSDSPTSDKLLRDYVGALKRVSEKQPVLMFIDDLHWSDASSIKLLSHLARNIRDLRVLVIGAYRPSDIAVEGHPLRDVSVEMQRYDKDAQIILNPLSQEGVRTLVDTLYPANRFPDTFAAWLSDTTGGAPLFVVESLRLMQERDEIVHDPKDGKWMAVRELNEGDLPRDVEAIVAKRLDRLPDDVHQALALAAVQGVTFDAAVLAHVIDKDELEVMKLLAPAEKVHEVIEYVGDIDLGMDVTARYRFTNNLFYHALRATLRGKERMLAYRRTAEGLDGLWSDDSEDVASKLAYLYEQGKAYDAAARFMIVVGHYARQAGSVARAIDLYQQAEHALENAHPQNAEDEMLIVRQRQQIDEALSDLAEVDASYDEAAARTRSALAPGMEALGWPRYAKLRMRLAVLRTQAGSYSEALEMLQALQATLKAAKPEDAQSYEAFQLRAEIAKVLALLGRADESAQTAENGLKELDALLQTDWYGAARARLTTSLAMAYHERGEYRRAIQMAEATLNVLRELNMVSTTALLLTTMAQLHVEVGDYDGARNCIQLMEKTASETSNESLSASAHLAAGFIHLMQSEPAAALAELDEADRLAEQVKAFDDRPKILMLRTFALLDLKRTDEAKATLDRLTPLEKEGHSHLGQAHAQLARARYALETGDAPTAVQLAQTASEMFQAEGVRFDEAIALRILARAHTASGQPSEAATEFERAASLFKLIGNDALAMAGAVSREASGTQSK